MTGRTKASWLGEAITHWSLPWHRSSKDLLVDAVILPSVSIFLFVLFKFVRSWVPRRILISDLPISKPLYGTRSRGATLKVSGDGSCEEENTRTMVQGLMVVQSFSRRRKRCMGVRLHVSKEKEIEGWRSQLR